MKKLILLSATFCALNTQAQYFQRWFGNSTLPSKKHAFYNGICTNKNYSGTDSTFYNVGIGKAVVTDSTAQYLTKYNELRFVKTSRDGSATGIINKGYAFKNPAANDSVLFHSAGYSICEIDSSTHQAGYIAVGNVTSNTKTGATISGGGSDAIIVKINNSGTIGMQSRIDFNSGSDILYDVIASKLTKTFYACGTSVFSGYSHLIVLKFTASGAIVWGNSYRFNDKTTETHDNKVCGYSLCEDSLGNIIVAGSIYNPDNGNGYDGLLAGFSGSTGNLNFYYTADYDGSDEAFRSIKRTADGQYIICGYTNKGSNYDLLLLKPSISSTGVSSFDFSKRISVPSVLNEKGYDVIERINSSNSPEYYIAGSAQIGAFTNSIIVKADSAGTPVNAYYPFTNLDYPEAVSIDFSDKTSYSAGLRLFSSHFTASGSNVNAYMARLYFNGASCSSCTMQTASSTEEDGSSSQFNVAKITPKTLTKMTSKSIDYSTDFLCNEVSISCGSNARLSEKNESDESINIDLLIYPNPAGNTLSATLNNDLQHAEARIFNSQGQLYFERKFENVNKKEPIQFDLTDFSKGIYFLQIRGEGVTSSKQFIKE